MGKHGGKRPGAGRKPKTMQLQAAVVTMQDQLPADILSVVISRLEPGYNSLRLIQHVMSAPETPSELKLKLAVAVMPFEIPKPERAKDTDADEEKMKQATDERIKSRLAQLLGKAGASGAAVREPASGDAAPAEPLRAVS